MLVDDEDITTRYGTLAYKHLCPRPLGALCTPLKNTPKKIPSFQPREQQQKYSETQATHG